jgi:hypothetical protein
MALNLKAIREALAAQINANTGRELHAYAYPPGSPGEMPAVVVRAGEEYVNYYVDQGAQTDVTFILDVIAPCRVSLEDGLRVLDELLSADAGEPNSVFDAIETDPTLGGAVVHCEVLTAGQHIGIGAVNDGRPEGVSAPLAVTVWVARS